MENLVAQIAKSLNGHDKDELYIIVRTEENYAFCCDGRLRMLDNPKKKKLKHLQVSNYQVDDIKDKIDNALKLSNSDIREAIEIYKNLNAKGE